MTWQPSLFAITLTRKDFRASLKGNIGGRGKSIPVAFEDALKTSLPTILSDVKSQLPGRRLKTHTRLYYKRTPKGASAQLVIGEGLPWAGVHAKFGNKPTIIRPKPPNQYLAIPISSVRKKAEAKQEGGSLWRHHPTLHFGKSKGGANPLLYWGKGKSGYPMFHLQKQVKIKPSVNLVYVNNAMSYTVSAALKEVCGNYDFGYFLLRRGK